jgi:hypothetical protein
MLKTTKSLTILCNVIWKHPFIIFFMKACLIKYYKLFSLAWQRRPQIGLTKLCEDILIYAFNVYSVLLKSEDGPLKGRTQMFVCILVNMLGGSMS